MIGSGEKTVIRPTSADLGLRTLTVAGEMASGAPATFRPQVGWGAMPRAPPSGQGRTRTDHRAWDSNGAARSGCRVRHLSLTHRRGQGGDFVGSRGSEN
jgi:hypothetical protein